VRYHWLNFTSLRLQLGLSITATTTDRIDSEFPPFSLSYKYLVRMGSRLALLTHHSIYCKTEPLNYHEYMSVAASRYDLHAVTETTRARCSSGSMFCSSPDQASPMAGFEKQTRPLPPTGRVQAFPPGNADGVLEYDISGRAPPVVTVTTPLY